MSSSYEFITAVVNDLNYYEKHILTDAQKHTLVICARFNESI